MNDVETFLVWPHSGWCFLFVSDWENKAVDSWILWITPHDNEVFNGYFKYIM